MTIERCDGCGTTSPLTTYWCSTCKTQAATARAEEAEARVAELEAIVRAALGEHAEVVLSSASASVGDPVREAFDGPGDQNKKPTQEQLAKRARGLEEMRRGQFATDPRPSEASTYTPMMRLRDIVDEAFGIQPVMTDDEALTFLERKLAEQRRCPDKAREDERALLFEGFVAGMQEVENALLFLRREGSGPGPEAWDNALDAVAAFVAKARASHETRAETPKSDDGFADFMNGEACAQEHIAKWIESLQYDDYSSTWLVAQIRAGEWRAVGEKSATSGEGGTDR